MGCPTIGSHALRPRLGRPTEGFGRDGGRALRGTNRAPHVQDEEGRPRVVAGECQPVIGVCGCGGRGILARQRWRNRGAACGVERGRVHQFGPRAGWGVVEWGVSGGARVRVVWPRRLPCYLVLGELRCRSLERSATLGVASRGYSAFEYGL